MIKPGMEPVGQKIINEIEPQSCQQLTTLTKKRRKKGKKKTIWIEQEAFEAFKVTDAPLSHALD